MSQEPQFIELGTKAHAHMNGLEIRDDSISLSEAKDIEKKLVSMRNQGIEVRRAVQMCLADLYNFLVDKYEELAHTVIDKRTYESVYPLCWTARKLERKYRRVSKHMRSSHYKIIAGVVLRRTGVEKEDDVVWFQVLCDEMKLSTKALIDCIDTEYNKRLLEQVHPYDHDKWNDYIELSKKYRKRMPYYELHKAIELGWTKAMELLREDIAYAPLTIMEKRKAYRKAWWRNSPKEDTWMDGWNECMKYLRAKEKHVR